MFSFQLFFSINVFYTVSVYMTHDDVNKYSLLIILMYLMSYIRQWSVWPCVHQSSNQESQSANVQVAWICCSQWKQRSQMAAGRKDLVSPHTARGAVESAAQGAFHSLLVRPHQMEIIQRQVRRKWIHSAMSWFTLWSLIIIDNCILLGRDFKFSVTIYHLNFRQHFSFVPQPPQLLMDLMSFSRERACVLQGWLPLARLQCEQRWVHGNARVLTQSPEIPTPLHWTERKWHLAGTTLKQG